MPPERSEKTPLVVAIPHLERDLGVQLVGRLGAPLDLTLTHNRRTWLSWRAGPRGQVRLRLHHAFLHAGPPVLDAVADFVHNRRLAQAREVLKTFSAAVPAPPPPRRRVRPAASAPHHHDLAALMADINQACFGGAPAPTIGWSRRATRGQPRRVRLGCYDVMATHITLNPLLDRPEVPTFVVQHIIHHELLHHHLPPTRGASRRVIHPPELRRLERSYEHHDAAAAWINTHLPELLASGR